MGRICRLGDRSWEKKSSGKWGTDGVGESRKNEKMQELSDGEER